MWESGGTEIQIWVNGGANGEGIAAGMIKLADLRLDLAGLDAGAKVPIMVTATDQTNLVGIGGTGGSGGVSGSLTTASDGLTVEAAKGDALTCGADPDASVTIIEGFAGAWDPVTHEIT